MNKSIREQLMALKDEGYQRFAASLIPTINNLIGIRHPELHKIAKRIAKSDWRTYLRQAEDEFFEEVMLQGMVLSYVSTDVEEHLRFAADFIPKIDNWSVCDTFCSGFKLAKQNKDRVWDFLQPYLASERDYDIRFGVVMLLTYYLDEEDISRSLQWFDAISHEGYYVRMAVAWAVSIAFIKKPEPTMAYLMNNSLDDFTYNKALQKIRESFKVDSAMKERIRQMKRRSVKLSV